MSLIADHKAKWGKHQQGQQALKLGQSKATASVPGKIEASGSVELQVLSQTIKADVASLKTAHPEHPARNAATPPYLDKYREYCAAALERGDIETRDPVMVQCAIWAINCAEFDYALKLVDHCKSMDSGMKRSLPELMTDSVLQDDRASDADRLGVFEMIDAEAWTVNHPLKAKVYKWGAYHFEKSDLSKAVDCAVTAHETYPNVGVKTFMETLQKRLAAQAGE